MWRAARTPRPRADTARQVKVRKSQPKRSRVIPPSKDGALGTRQSLSASRYQLRDFLEDVSYLQSNRFLVTQPEQFLKEQH
jgi:hypothetical protein